jgi:SAM-dependent methyltransferase
MVHHLAAEVEALWQGADVTLHFCIAYDPPVLKRMSPAQAEACLADAAASPLSDSGMHYPAWYLHRWHFLPEGYLSRRSVAGYDHVIRRLYHAGMERQALARLSTMARRLHPEAILEMGCGPGRAIQALKRALPEARITAVDLSPFMLERAARRAGTDAAEFIHASAAALPSSAGSFDIVIAAHVLGHVPATVSSAAHAEAARVLRKGGRLIAIDHWWHPEPPSPLRRLRSSWLVPGLTRLSVWAQPLTAESDRAGVTQ